jgi:ABC-type Fe3+/spermidine/putrescine transport system ATPase subunit
MDARSPSVIEIVDVYKAYRRVDVLRGISLRVHRGEFVAVLGPSGCGKTTLLRIVAGLTPIDAGAVYLHGERVDHLPAHRRRVGFVFQSYALFPHLTVAENVGFGVRARAHGGAEPIVTRMLSLVGLGDEAHKYPRELSGGQQQRVALARALAIQPLVLLLDEPFSNLDLKLRQAMRLEIRRLHDQLAMTTILVTHDQTEALTMADRVVLMASGAVIQDGTPDEVYQRPRTRFVADFVGDANALEGTVVSLLAPGRAHVVLTGWGIAVEACGHEAVAAGDAVTVIVRPEHLRLDRAVDGGLRGRIAVRMFMGPGVRCWVDLADAPRVMVDVPSGEAAVWPEGTEVGLRVNQQRLWYVRT